MICKRVIYLGDVQGVGFRATTRRIASQYQVAGYVRNLDDGSVECVAQGDSTNVDSFLKSIEQTMAGYITNKVETMHPDNKTFTSFEIAR